MSYLNYLLVLAVIVNLFFFGLAYLSRSDKFTDGTYALTFIILASISLGESHRIGLYNLILYLMVLSWTLRLGIFLVFRVNKVGKDRRFDNIRENFFRFLRFWVIQGVSVWILMLAADPALKSSSKWHSLGYSGLAIWLIGLLIESLADQQKAKFKANSKNSDKWIDEGIWSYSRHPNYFGEILVWVGIYVYSFEALSSSYQKTGVLSPIYIAILLIFVSGIPILEKSADRRWGKLPAYKKYKSETSLLIPLPRLRDKS